MEKLESKLKKLEQDVQIKGTFEEIVDKVPTKAISMMVSQNRDVDYVFTVDIQNGFLLVW